METVFTIEELNRDIFNSRLNAAQSFRKAGLLFESLAALAEARNARQGKPGTDDPDFPNLARFDALSREFWNRGMRNSGYA